MTLHSCLLRLPRTMRLPDRHIYPTDHVHAQRKRGRHGRGGQLLPLVSLLSLWTCRLGFHIPYSNFVYATLQCKHTFAILMNCQTMIWCINSVTTNRVFFPGIFEPNEGGSPFRRKWEVVAPPPGGLGGRPPRCRATGLAGTRAQIFYEKFRKNPLPPGSGAVGVYSCKF